ncbi:nuclear transport factor 2 family protein [Paenibacillus sanguinis]|uniref:nuclear transport factor 2 family protein n=1 Tax=Paenibacillus sanguinis TaxID=225906 RepID=UPI00037BF415|nr:nuclear transport factor 2 family protein [Paenibacillus sanguinis]
MNRDEAVEKINLYFEAWVEKNFKKFEKLVHENAIVRECNGGVIEGRDELHRWFKEWNQGSNRVIYWKINFIGYDNELISAFVEWEFKCIYAGIEYEWCGSSIVNFKDSLIIEINEYEMKYEKFYPYRCMES